jgi:thiol-disulfide isomerase/thioredoxin
MSRTALALLGVAILGLAAGGVYRELTSAGAGPDAASVPGAAASGAAPAAGPGAAGRAFPDLRFTDGAGKTRSLAEFRGRTVLLNVWATWCAPCREEMPALDRVQAALGGPDFEVVALSMDPGGVPVVRKFYDELGLRALGIYVDENAESVSKLGSVGIPLTVLVDRQGRELWRVVGPRKWDQAPELDRIRAQLAQAR